MAQKTRNFRDRPLPPPGRGIVLVGRRFNYDNTFPTQPTGKSAVCSVLSEKRKGGPRKNCPVQLTFIDGKPYLRLCLPENVGGKIMPRAIPLPENGAAANAIAKDVCARWSAGDKTFASVRAEGETLGRFRRRWR